MHELSFIGRGITSLQANFAQVYNLREMTPDGSAFDRLLSEGDVLMLDKNS